MRTTPVVYCCVCAGPVLEPGLWLAMGRDVCSRECGREVVGYTDREWMVELRDHHVTDTYVWTAGTPVVGLVS